MSTWLDTVLADAFSGAVQYKPSVRIAHDAGNVTLSGEQTIQALAILAGERVALFGQTAPEENGIWLCAVGGWSRALDADGVGDLEAGTLVYVAEGTYAGGLLTLTTTGPIYPGATAQTWQVYTPAVVYGAVGSVSQIDPGDTASAGVAGTAARIDHQHAVNSAVAATASTLVARDASGATVLGWLSVGTAPYGSTGYIRAGTQMGIVASDGGDISLLDYAAGTLTLGDSTTIATTELRGTAVLVDSGAGDITVDAGAALTCTGATTATITSTTGALVLAAVADTTTATLSTGTGGNNVSIVCSSTGDTITHAVNGTTALALTTTQATVGVVTVGFGPTVASPVLRQDTRTTDALPSLLTLSAQSSWASSTGANKVGGSLLLASGRGKVDGTDLAGDVRINVGSLVSSASSILKIESGTLGSPTSFCEIQDLNPYARIYTPARHLTLLSGADIALNAGSGGALYLVGSTAAMETWLGSGTRSQVWKHNASTEVYKLETDGSLTSQRRTSGTATETVTEGAIVTSAAAAVVDLYTHTMASGDQITVEAHLEAARTDSGNDRAARVVIASFKDVAGTVSQVGTTTAVHTAEDAALASFGFDIATAHTVKIQFAGRGAETWKGRVFVQIRKAVIS